MAGDSEVWPGTDAAKVVSTRSDSPPVYTYAPTAGVPPVSIVRIEPGSLAGADPAHAHSHDFLTIAYFEHGGGSLRLGAQQWPIRAGDVYVVAPGEVMGFGEDMAGLEAVEGWGVFFPAEGLGSAAPSALLMWRAHPLLFPFARGIATGAQRLTVPVEARLDWTQRILALDRELSQRADGYRQAVTAQLTLLLVDLSRLATDVAGDLQLRNEPILSSVFETIEHSYTTPLSLRDVAAALSLTPGYLTTMVRRKTGRTVQEWITERRMAEARRLLVQSDLTVAEIANCTGYAEPAYFIRTFRRAHGTTPLKWRQNGR
ncbi:MAG: AraC family transcriptional regulator [Mycobacterium sp.]